jgi:hypothetical protein
MTTLDAFGWVTSVRRDFHWKVLMETMIITATSDAIGICAT